MPERRIESFRSENATSAETADGAADRVERTRGQICDRYKQRLHERGFVDFDDLISIPRDVLWRDADLREQYQRRWKWISVDEFQDIDAPQYDLVTQLTKPSGNICVIGDPDRSIYAFRGADPSLFEKFLRGSRKN